jgi:chromosome segregation ATPase
MKPTGYDPKKEPKTEIIKITGDKTVNRANQNEATKPSSFTNNLDYLQKTNSELADKLSYKTRENDKLQKELSNINSRTHQKLTTLHLEVNSLTKKAQSLEKELGEVKHELKTKTSENERLKTELMELKIDKSKLEIENSHNKELISALKDTFNKNTQVMQTSIEEIAKPYENTIEQLNLHIKNQTQKHQEEVEDFNTKSNKQIESSKEIEDQLKKLQQENEELKSKLLIYSQPSDDTEIIKILSEENKIDSPQILTKEEGDYVLGELGDTDLITKQ